MISLTCHAAEVLKEVVVNVFILPYACATYRTLSCIILTTTLKATNRLSFPYLHCFGSTELPRTLDYQPLDHCS